MALDPWNGPGQGLEQPGTLGGGTRQSLRSLATQTIPGFHDLPTPVSPSGHTGQTSPLQDTMSLQHPGPCPSGAAPLLVHPCIFRDNKGCCSPISHPPPLYFAQVQLPLHAQGTPKPSECLQQGQDFTEQCPNTPAFVLHTVTPIYRRSLQKTHPSFPFKGCTVNAQ